MITTIVSYFNSWHLLIAFLCHITIFISTLYVAVHNRELETWVVTTLWYLGIMSGFVTTTVLVQWFIGPEHPLSYWTLGTLGEVGSHIILGFMCLLLLIKTIQHKINYK